MENNNYKNWLGLNRPTLAGFIPTGDSIVWMGGYAYEEIYAYCHANVSNLCNEGNYTA
jgi:hypothetical protein